MDNNIGNLSEVSVRIVAGSNIPGITSTYKTVVLKPHVKNGENLLTQNIINEYGENTKFIIKYDFEIADNVIIPEHCILEFDGGSVSGGTLVGNMTYLQFYQEEEEVIKGTVLQGTFADSIPHKISELEEDSLHRTVADEEKKTWNSAVQPDDLASVATSGSYNDLIDKPIIPAGQVQSDWGQTRNTESDYIKNKPVLGTASSKDVAASGNASDSQVVMGNDTRLSDARSASDVYAWAKEETKPSYTKSEIGLGNVTNDAQIKRSEMGAASGVATLDDSGKVPSSQLPSYVDDVLEYENLAAFPTIGESGKIYVAKDTNLTYRWSGSAYVVISSSLVLGETSSTAYRGDRGKAAYDHSQLTSGNPHNVTKSEVGLGDVGNFKAVSTVANQGLNNTEKSNARANIGAGTSSFSGNYNDLTNKPAIPSRRVLVLDSTVPLANQITTANYIYVVNDDFIIPDNTTIIIPVNCVLKFINGTINGGTNSVLKGTYTGIETTQRQIFDTNVILTGSWNVDCIYAEWFGAKANDATDCTAALQKAIDTTDTADGKLPVQLISGTYRIKSSLITPSFLTIRGIVHRNDCIIKATATFTGMFKAKNDTAYTYLMFSGFTLDGDNKATDGLYYPNYGFIYSHIYNMSFDSINGYAINSDDTWATKIDKCHFDHCENGILAGSGNGLEIVNNDISHITKVGATVGGYGVRIMGNVFDVMGHCAIILASESKATIDSNYFEECSQNGMVLQKENITTSRIRPVIVVNGVGISRYTDSTYYGFGKTYPSTVTVTNNYLDSPERDNTYPKFFVFACSLDSAKITDNVSRESVNVRYALGLMLDNDFSDVHDIEVSRNYNFNNYEHSAERVLMPKVGGVNPRNITYLAESFYNIYSNDISEDARMEKNIAFDCLIGRSQNNIVTEQTDRYLGRQVFYCEQSQTLYFDKATLDGHTVVDPSVYDNKFMTLEYYSRPSGSNTWTKTIINSVEGLTHLPCYFPTGGGYITFPVIRVAGERYVDDRDTYKPYAYGNTCLFGDQNEDGGNDYMRYLEGTELRLIENTVAHTAYITYNGAATMTTPYIRQISKNAVQSRGNLKNSPNRILGLSLIDPVLGKPIWWNGTKWIEADGTDPDEGD